MDQLPKMFVANGKLLLTGEYLVLYGAQAFAVPLNFGQSITISSSAGNSELHWIAFDKTGIWFSATFNTKTMRMLASSDEGTALRLQDLLQACRMLNPTFLKEVLAYDIQTVVDFNRQWGLGTSSTLIVVLSQWANIDPFALHFAVSKGSGYDIACGLHPVPLLYQLLDKKPMVTAMPAPDFLKKYAYFIYLGNKQLSEKSIAGFLKKSSVNDCHIESISALTKAFLAATSPEDITDIMWEHERITGALLHEIPVQQKYFKDFQGAIKSLGAWGGDFIMAFSTREKSYVYNYFQNKQYLPIFMFKEIVKY